MNIKDKKVEMSKSKYPAHLRKLSGSKPDLNPGKNILPKNLGPSQTAMTSHKSETSMTSHKNETSQASHKVLPSISPPSYSDDIFEIDKKISVDKVSTSFRRWANTDSSSDAR